MKSTKADGNEAYKNGNFQEAYDLYSKALSIDPDNVSTCAKLYYNRGVVASRVMYCVWYYLAFIFIYIFGFREFMHEARHNRDVKITYMYIRKIRYYQFILCILSNILHILFYYIYSYIHSTNPEFLTIQGISQSYNLTLSHPEALPWEVKSYSVRQSKLTKGTVLASLGEKGLRKRDGR